MHDSARDVKGQLESLIASKCGYLEHLAIPFSGHEALGREVLIGRISGALASCRSDSTNPDGKGVLDLDEAIIGFVTALAHFAVASHAVWKSRHASTDGEARERDTVAIPRAAVDIAGHDETRNDSNIG
jgi:hypothetical protein